MQLEALTVTDANLIAPLVNQLVAAEHVHTYAEAEALLPILPKLLGEEGVRLAGALRDEDAHANALMRALANAKPEVDFLAFKAALAKLADALRAHLAREQDSIFPLLEAKMSAAERTAFANALVAAKGRAPAPSIRDAIVDSVTGFGAAIGNLFSKVLPTVK